MPDAIEKIKQLDQERSQLIATAKKQALERAQSALADLNALGFGYRLVEDGKSARQVRQMAMRQKRDVPCPVCTFKTSPPHDARKHRSQGKRKRAFTVAELQEWGLKKV